MNENQEGRTEKASALPVDLNNSASVLNNKYIYVLLILTGIGIFLRLYHLSFNSLWLDEAATYNYAKQSLLAPWQAIWNANIQEYTPPLFYWIEHFMLFFGSSEFILRLVPALFGIATIPLMYFIGREIADRNVGIIAAALMTFSPFHIYYSQEARTYSLMVFLIGLAFLFLLKGVRQRRASPWVLFGIFSALAFWAHFHALIPLAIFFAYALIFTLVKSKNKKHDFKNIGYSLLIFIITTLPLLIVMYKRFFIISTASYTWGFHGTSIIYQTVLQMSGSNVTIMRVLAALFCIGIIMLYRNDKSKSILLMSLLVICFTSGLFLSRIMPMAERYLLYLLPAYLVGIACSYKIVFKFIKSKYVIYAFTLLSLLLLIPFNINYYTQLNKQDWRGLSNYLEESAKSQDYVVLIPSYVHIPFDYYYNCKSKKVTEFQADTVDKLEQIRSSSENNSIFYVVANNIYNLESKTNLLKWLKTNTTLVYSSFQVWVYK